MNSKVDTYLIEGCGRCDFYRSPKCKVHFWPSELKRLRQIILECGLKEEIKWSNPCYTFQNKNVLMLSAFKKFASIAFFKGSLLKDEKKLLVAPGENSQASRQLCFTDEKDIRKIEQDIKAYIFEAIEIEKAGLKVNFKKESGPWPEELVQKFEELPKLKVAFEKLSPGRQRGYILYFSQAKQSKTRETRIDRCIPKILDGVGLNEYKKSL